MTDLRLLQARERALLRAGADEAPSAEARQALACALGLSSTAGLFAYGLHLLLRRVSHSSLSAYAIASAVGVTAVGGGAYHFPHGVPFNAVVDSPRSGDAVAAPGVPRATASVDHPTLSAEAVSSSALSPVEADSHRVPPHATLRTTPPRDASDAVRRQVSVLDRARFLATSGNPAGSLRAVDEYERRFPDGLFSEEATMLRMDVALARNDLASARTLARSLLAEHPLSVHAERARSVIKQK